MFLKSGITDPDDSITFPNLTIEIFVELFANARDWHISSDTLLVTPIRLVGLTALSVEIRVKLLTLSSTASLHSNSVP